MNAARTTMRLTRPLSLFCFATQRAYVVYPPEGPRPPQSKRELDAYLANRRSEEKKRR